MERFAGRVALVTGAASGIGRATATRLAADGATVACVDLAADGCAEVEAAIGEAGGKAAAFTCDVSSEEDVTGVVEAVTSLLGPIDVVCNVAGIGHFAHTTEESLAGWDRIIAVNLTGTFLVCRATLPGLLDRRGAIVNVASSAGLQGQPYSAAYSASKGGVAILTRALAAEFVDRGIRVNAVAPGGIDTPIIGGFGWPEGANPKFMDRLMTPMGFGRPEDVAATISFLASDEARHMTGAVVTVDGGLTA